MKNRKWLTNYKLNNRKIGFRSRIYRAKTRNNALDVVCGKVTILPAAHAAATHKVILPRNSALSRQIFCFFSNHRHPELVSGSINTN